MPDLDEELSSQRALNSARQNSQPTLYFKIALLVMWGLVSFDANTGGTILSTKYNTLINFTLFVLALDLFFALARRKLQQWDEENDH